MEIETREKIEKALDEIINNLSLDSSAVSISNWVMKDVVGFLDKDFRSEIKSAEDSSVGYVLGYMSRMAHEIILNKKRAEKVSAIINTSRNKESTKIESVTKKVYIAVNKTETEDVRKILKARLPLIREEIIKALNV